MKYRVKRHSVVQPLDQSYRLIPLTRGKTVIVDAADYEWLSQWSWQTQRNKAGNFYAVRKVKNNDGILITKLMHRELLRCSPKREIDHRDGNSLDNRRNNLRKCTRHQNCGNREKAKNNSSGYKGVGIREHGKWSAWRARVGHKNLGHFSTAEEAARAYDAAAKIYFGEFALLNFPS